MDIHENTLKYGPWSISKADVARQCPLKFNHQYVLKTKVERGRSVEALIGKTVHQVLEFSLCGRSVRKSFELSIEQFDLTSTEKEEVLSFVPNVEHFMKEFNGYSKRHKGNRLEIEDKLGVTIDGKPCAFFDKDVFLRGVVDLHMRFGRKPIGLILDHKTGKTRDISYYENQFNAYALFLKAHQPELAKLKMAIYFARSGDIVFKNGLDDVTNLDSVLERVISAVNQAAQNLSDMEKATPTPLCGWCDYKCICPAHMDGDNGKENANEG
jgi:CRISPR/Cas system-associated exonuclease Cas4 (RecB family)